MTYRELENLLAGQRILPLFYQDDLDTCIRITEALYQAGIRVMEFTNRGAQAQANYRELLTVIHNRLPGLHLGVGTIRSEEDVTAFGELGAAFLVSPFFLPEIGDAASSRGLPWIPGCMTPTEIRLAETQGHHLVKLFPGDVLGATYVKAVRPLFPDMKFLVTGGVEAQVASIRSWLDAGVLGVGLGGKLLSPELIRLQQWDQLTAQARTLLHELSATLSS